MGGGMSTSGGGRRRNSRTPQSRLMSEINVTPFVDVMLVLLIIFMITAPLLTIGVPIDLPQAAAGVLDDEAEPITVTIDSEGRIFIQDQQVAPADVAARLVELAAGDFSQRIYFRGDANAAYGTAVSLLNQIQLAGFPGIALVTEEEQR